MNYGMGYKLKINMFINFGAGPSTQYPSHVQHALNGDFEARADIFIV